MGDFRKSGVVVPFGGMTTNEKRVKIGVALVGLALGVWMGLAMVTTPEPTVYETLDEIVTDASGLRDRV